jgi:hypothetical protein
VGVLIEVLRGLLRVRALWWAHEEQVLSLVHRLSWADALASLGEGHGLRVNREWGTAELLAPHERRSWRVALPSWMASAIQGRDMACFLDLWAVPELGVLVFACPHAAGWMELEALHALPRHPEVRWRTVDHHPLEEASARMGGEVVFTGPTRVMVNLDDQNQARLPLLPGLERGQRVVLEGRRTVALGMAHYLWLEHGGERLRLVEDAPGEERAPVEQHALGKPARKRTSSYGELAPRLRRRLRLALPEEPEAVKHLLHTAVGPGTVPEQTLTAEQLFDVVVAHLSERLHEGGAVLYHARLAHAPEALVGGLREAVEPFGVRPRYVAGTEPWELVDDTLPGHTARLAMKSPVSEAVGFINACLREKGSDARLYLILGDTHSLWLALSQSDATHLARLRLALPWDGSRRSPVSWWPVDYKWT